MQTIHRNSAIIRAQDATPAPFADATEVVNYLLALEHMEAAFHRVGMRKFDAADFEALGFQGAVRDNFVAISEHERSHVKTLTEIVADLGGKAVTPAQYDFPYRTLAEFLSVGAELEAIGVAAYAGVSQFLQGEADLLGTILAIHSVEARHAAYLNLMTGANPFPTAFEVPQTTSQIESAVADFVAE
jgi:hypothetical protein